MVLAVRRANAPRQPERKQPRLIRISRTGETFRHLKDLCRDCWRSHPFMMTVGPIMPEVVAEIVKGLTSIAPGSAEETRQLP